MSLNPFDRALLLVAISFPTPTNFRMDDFDVFERKNDSSSTETNLRNRKVQVAGASDALDSSSSTDTLQPRLTALDQQDDDKNEVVYGRTHDGKSELVSLFSDCNRGPEKVW